MKHPDKLWYDITKRFAEQSKCKSRQVGCVIVYENRLIGQGYNSAPEGSTTEHCPRERCLGKPAPSGGALDQAICCHAEASAIGYCARHGIATRGSVIYLTCHPCSECAKLIVAAGIVEVVFDQDYATILAQDILKRAGVQTRRFIL